MKAIEKCARGGLAIVLALGMAPLPAFAEDIGVATSPALTAESSQYAGVFTYSDEGVVADEGSSGYKISGTELTINASGVYRITGSCTEGNIKVKKGTTGVALVLEDLDLTCSTTAPLAINKDNGETCVRIEGTVALTDAEDPANEDSADAEAADAFEGAAVKVKSGSSLMLGGSGSLVADGSTCKNGIKGADGANLRIALEDEGSLTVRAANDGINSDGDIDLASGAVLIAVDDDAVHSEAALTVGVDGASDDALSVDITDCTEGLEGNNVVVRSGSINVNASDDGVNAAGDSGGESVEISGGQLYVECGGDGIDTNGDLDISGGTTVIWSGDQPEDPLDYDGTFTLAGGTVVAVGANGMGAAAPRGTQAYAVGGLSLSKGDTLTVSEGGTVQYTQTAPKAASYIFYTSPTMTDGDVAFSPASANAGGMAPGNGAAPGNGSAPGGNMAPGANAGSAPSGSQRPGSMAAGASSSVSYSGANTIASSTVSSGNAYISTTGGQNALLVSGGTSTLTNATVTKTGSPGSHADDYDFYGTNAGILVYNGATLNLIGGKVTTNASYANGVFATGTGTANLDGTVINTSANNSGGIMVTGGGTLVATDCTVTTLGGSSAPIRSDRGGGTLTVNGGSYTSSGTGSPAIYSTANVTVNNATLTSNVSEAVVVEGKNSVTLNGVTMTSSNTKHNNSNSTVYKGVMLYQSMSGDASVGTSTFTAKDSTITTNNGAVFYVTNTSSVINLTNNTFVSGSGTGSGSGEFLRAASAGWGTSGRNGGNVTLNMTNQEASGNIVVDGISTVTMNLTSGSVFTGILNGANTGKSVALKLSADSKLVLMGDSYVSSLENADASGSNIELNGYTLHVGETPVDDGTGSGSSSGGSDNGSGMPGAPGGQPGSGSMPGAPGGNGAPPEPPSGNAPGDSNSASSNSVPMYRLYNPNSGEHFYTSSASERSQLVSLGWRYEGVGWNAPSSGNPVYRLYNPNAGDHHYTTSEAERNGLIRLGWKDEGVGWRTAGASGVPLYREYNPNATTGAHNYTTSKTEHELLCGIGWRDEGVGWYGV